MDKDETEQALLSRCLKKEDPSAWERFVQRYSNLIWSSIHRTFRSYSFSSIPEDAEDVYSAVFLSLLEDDFRRLRQFQRRNACSLGTWLAVVAVNRSIDFLRRQKRRRCLVSLDDETLFLEPITDGRLNAETLLIEQQRTAALANAAAALSSQEKHLLELVLSDRHSAEETARALGTTVEAFYTRKHRLIDKIKKSMNAP